ncbi:hypothetical protein DESUT3_07390 [Desulfuromonas versatilis]|uniref:Uncharacterized protein n=1 Tax=Desulfuromonas versatilis TaxID=2802975 RepID=A0ABN6DUD6_9BACT|nr:hypothetical protein [Desulfuromonas versatilis]BCR03670.1 hypothetical protein DESUT3_07390 [Desulfuromonas versatilis]
MIPKTLLVKARPVPFGKVRKTPAASDAGAFSRRRRREPRILQTPDSPRQSYQFSVSRLVALENLHAQWLAVRIHEAGGSLDTPEMDWRTAGQLVVEDGYFGQEQTLTRVLKLMLAISGNDPACLEQARKGFHAGFVEMSGEWGEAFPEVCCLTYNVVMAKLDGWLDNLRAAPAPSAPGEQK